MSNTTKLKGDGMMDDIKKCGHKEAIEMLMKGALVFTEIKKDIVEERTGCRKCKEARKGNFCSVCGSKVTDKMEMVVDTEVTKFRLEYTNDTLYMGTMKKGDLSYGHRKTCDFSLNFFLTQTKWGWIWR